MEDDKDEKGATASKRQKKEQQQQLTELLNRVKAIKDSQTASALELCDEMLLLDPKNLNGLFYRGYCLDVLKRYQDRWRHTQAASKSPFVVGCSCLRPASNQHTY